MEEKKIKSFTDLNAWKEAPELVMIIYKTTKNFPKDELFGLTNQIRRAVVSITSNITESFSRNTFKEIGGQTVIVSKLCNGLLKSNRLKHNS